MPTTIGRNRRQYVINVKAEYTECEKYDADLGDWVRADAAEAWRLVDHPKENRQARLIESDDRSVYTIRCTDVIYELRKPSREPDDPLSTSE